MDFKIGHLPVMWLGLTWFDNWHGLVFTQLSLSLSGTKLGSSKVGLIPPLRYGIKQELNFYNKMYSFIYINSQIN